MTGSHRSGSTWVGLVLATVPDVFYIHEPLNARFAPHYLGLTGLPWFPYLDSSDNPRCLPPFRRLLSGRFPAFNLAFLRPDRLLRWRLLHAFTFRRAAARRHRFLLKDPFALFAVDWLEAHFHCRTVLLLRHPFAFVASLKRKSWAFDFCQWTAQPALLEGPLASFRTEIETAAKRPPDLIDQACLLWKCLTRQTLALTASHEQRLLLRHEDLCAAPVDRFQEIFQRLGLPWTRATEQFLREPEKDPRQQLDTWKKRLDSGEMHRIRQATEPFAAPHYSFGR